MLCTLLLFWCVFIIQNGWTALAAAASNGHEQVVDVLLKAGAKPDIQSKVIECVHADCNVHVLVLNFVMCTYMP